MKILSKKLLYIFLIVFIFTLSSIKSEFDTSMFDVTDPDEPVELKDDIMGSDEVEASESFPDLTEEQKNAKREALYNLDNYDESKYLTYPQRAFKPFEEILGEEKIDYNEVNDEILRVLYQEINLLQKDFVDQDTFRVLCFKFLTNKNNSDSKEENYFYALICEEILFDTTPIIHITKLHEHLLGERFYAAMKKVMTSQLGEEDGLENYNNIMEDVHRQNDLARENEEALNRFRDQMNMTEEDDNTMDIFDKMREIASENEHHGNKLDDEGINELKSLREQDYRDEDESNDFETVDHESVNDEPINDDDFHNNNEETYNQDLQDL